MLPKNNFLLYQELQLFFFIWFTKMLEYISIPREILKMTINDTELT